jgi:hypothetical protein
MDKLKLMHVFWFLSSPYTSLLVFLVLYGASPKVGEKIMIEWKFYTKHVKHMSHV